MSNIFGDWINSDDGLKFDDDFQGVTRTDGRNVERGDRDDTPKVKRQVIPYEYNEQESKAKLRARLSDMDAKHKRALIESGYGQVPEGQKSNYREAHEASAKRRLADAIAEGQASRQNPRVDPISNTSPGYVEPHERHSNGYAFLALVVAMCGLVIMALTGG